MSVEEDLKQRIELVRSAFAKLRSHHVSWIVNAARDHFLEAITEAELDVIRHTNTFGPPVQPIFSPGEERTRADLLRDAQRLRDEYTAIVHFLNALEHALNLWDAIEFSKHIATMFTTSEKPVRK